MLCAQRADPEGLWIRRLINIPDSELEQIYRAAWVVIQPSFDEGFCLPLLEAAAHGTPAVHSGRGSMPEVVGCVNANSVHPAALSERVVELADPKRYVAASRSALADCARMSPARFANELTRLIIDVRAAPHFGRHHGVGRVVATLRSVGP
jgi:glycosyltransferase involved in cell wall biosynthesis